MNVSVKICGIRSIESALATLDADADFIGLNFVPSSKRKVSLAVAKEIVAAIKGKVKVVGVFQNAEVGYVNETAETVGLDFVQLHGDENPAYCKQIKTDVIKAVSLKKDVNLLINEMQMYEIAFFLLDRKVQGKGDLVNVGDAKQIAEQCKLFLAGGLTPENVASIVSEVRPFAVDVAGGIETEGKEDAAKIKQFVMNAKGVEL